MTSSAPAPEPPADDPGVESIGLDSDLGWAIRLVSGAFRRIATGSVAALPGGPRGYLVLMAVVSGPPRSQLAIAQQLALNKTVMTYLLDDLEAEGLLTRQPDPVDRRARRVLITEKGTRALDEARARLGMAEARLLGDLDPAEEQQLRQLLERVARTARLLEIDPAADCR
ncbi:MarR family winged helix-turn-helix transcriptional regulator [Actinokineospora sp. PR83]|uniref:MarR family winged helix-turn-helix transcriptional regulator n=1 Tax=Actinokineospora sp. PR83 TaxID=2884908 RepID=UPI001F481B7D|nr:MarR family winged helix-turn-helix transcriptional regulator [Actinokineospora sp. PR83]MCG8916790.1 MarR family winged helix-turn-helix transcriptional regulator [Actinokineospora sp. PR83]